MSLDKPKILIVLLVTALVLTSQACGTVQVGVATPTPEEMTEPAGDIQEVISEHSTPTDEDSPAEEEQAPEAPTPEPETSSTAAVMAWLGHIASLPQGSQYDDFVILSPEGTGEFGLTGATPEIEAEIRTLRDAEGANEFVHLWGSLSCEVVDYNKCQLVVDKLQYGANYSEDTVASWVGTIKSQTFNNGPSHAFELAGEFPMWYSIHASQDEALQAQIEALQDTGAVVKVSGKLLVGIPDVNGTRIEVSQLEVLEGGTIKPEPETDEANTPSAEWPTFVNDRYGYQVKHPLETSISLYGPNSFSGDELPEGMSSPEYLDQLSKTYTDRLCVQFEYSLGWIYISVPPNQEHLYTSCGPTGIGAGEIINKIENVYVGDQLYQANGWEIKLQVDNSSGGIDTGETLDMHYEFFIVDLEDGTRIAFGAAPRNDATYEDYVMKTKEMLLQILATYEAIP
ncbi:MAG: hypothetical protein MUO67_14860 [Anaerolineales bacterium]|nr:hypothetical protein [Anaerolineales bacterium]